MIRSIVALALVLACAACTSDDQGGGSVAATPLRGNFRGAAFVGMRAYATRISPSAKIVNVLEAEVGCAEVSKQKQGIAVIVTWQTGYSRDFNGDGTTASNAVFFYDDNGAKKNTVAEDGRVELVESSPEKGSKGRLRLRALSLDSDVEGEIGFEVCD
jgi:hypothetical protein